MRPCWRFRVEGFAHGEPGTWTRVSQFLAFRANPGPRIPQTCAEVRSFEVVELIEHGTHQGYLVDTIQFQAPTRTLDPRLIVSLYAEKGLSTFQVAQQLGCSKSFVITTLKRNGLLRQGARTQTDPENYRNAAPPFGYRVSQGKLVPNSVELKICRKIVDLINRQGWTYLRVAQLLCEKGIKNRHGTPVWHHYTVSRIYKRWKGKV